MLPSPCPKCGSKDVIPDVNVRGGFHDRTLKVDVVENPEAWVYKGVHESILLSTLCGQCGFVELYAKDPTELLKAHRQK